MRSSLLTCGLVLSFFVVSVSAGCSSTTGGTDTDAGTSSADSGAVLPDAATTPDTGASCEKAKSQLLTPIAQVSNALVKVLKDEGGVKTVYVDATVGGVTGVTTKPRVYVNLGSATRVDIDDNAATTSTDWDLAFKRPVVFTNGGEAGIGVGKAGFVDKDFDAVTAADEAAAKLAVEDFLDDDCNPILDRIDNPATSLSTWYDYNEQTHVLTPFKHVYLIRGGTGKLYKMQIVSFYSNPDGSIGTEGGGRFQLKIAAL